jgi:transketolase
VRQAFARTLIDAAESNRMILLLTGDHGYELFNEFRHRLPNQFINAGIAEQNMVGVAAGLAKSGFLPVVYALSAFVPIRTLEQIKLDVCYENLPVMFVGDGAGVVYSTLGVSHQSIEDMAAVRALPQLRILSPGDAFEMEAAMELAFVTPSPIYLRIGKADLGSVHTSPPKLTWGRLAPIIAGEGPLVFLATGSMLGLAVELAREWQGTAVWSACSLKPIDVESIVSACRPHRIVVTLEEHNVLGGFGGAIAEILSQEYPLPICRVGIQDCYYKPCGSYAHVMRQHGLDLDSVRTRVQAFASRHSCDPA